MQEKHLACKCIIKFKIELKEDEYGDIQNNSWSRLYRDSSCSSDHRREMLATHPGTFR